MKNYIALNTTEKQLQAEFKKPVVEITQSEMEMYIEKIRNNYTYNTMRTKQFLINTLMKQKGSDVYVEFTIEGLESVEKNMITEKELLEVINMLDNAQDRFLLMAIFRGIAGKQAKNIINLKSTDIDFKNNIIRLPEKTIAMDATLAKLAKDAIDEKEYTVISSDFVGKVETYEVNEKSNYLIKVRPYKKNNNGMDAMSYNGFRTRFGSICKFLDLDITISSLEKSGVISRMLKEDAGDTVRDIEDWLKKNSIKMERFLAFRLYKQQKTMI